MGNGFGKYDVYAVSGSVYCYGDTGVLKNRFGIQDGSKLRELEADISAIRQNDLLVHPNTSSALMEKLGLKSKEGFRRNYLKPALDMNLVCMTIPDKPNSRNQRYIRT